MSFQLCKSVLLFLVSLIVLSVCIDFSLSDASRKFIRRIVIILFLNILYFFDNIFSIIYFLCDYLKCSLYLLDLILPLIH